MLGDDVVVEDAYSQDTVSILGAIRELQPSTSNESKVPTIQLNNKHPLIYADESIRARADEKSADELREAVWKLSLFIPRFLQAKIVYSPGFFPVLKTESVQDGLNAAVLMVDFSGIELDAFLKFETNSVENRFNEYFNGVVDLINSFDGDIIQYSSHALYAIWRPQEKENSLERIAVSAAACALEIRYKLEKVHQMSRSDNFSVQMVLGLGRISITYVPSSSHRIYLVPSGEAFNQISNISSRTSPGQVVCSPEMWALIEDDFTAHLNEHDLMALLSKKGSVFVPSPSSGPISAIDSFGAETANIISSIYSFLQASVWLKISQNPKAISPNLPNAQWDSMNEIRRVTVLVIKISGFKIMKPSIDIIQNGVDRYEGNIDNIMVDHDTLIVITSFGIPGLSHEDDPIRAIKTCLMIKNQLNNEGLHSSMSISTGRLFCGSLGTDLRRLPLILGEPILTCMKLVTRTENRYDTFCDAETYSDAKNSIEFERLGEVQIQGSPESILVYRPLGDIQMIYSARLASLKNIMVGRTSELEHMAGKIRRLCDNGDGSVNVIEADSGMGKSTLIRELVRLANDAFNGRITLLCGSGSQLEGLTSYYAFRTILSDLFEFNHESSSNYDELVITKLPTPEMRQMAPLLSDIIPNLDFPENKFTKSMNNEARSNSILDFLTKLMLHVTKSAPVLLLVENVQWLDPSSWSLIQALATDLNNILIVLTCRPDSEDLKYKEFLQATHCTRIKLRPLSDNEIEKLLCNHLGVNSIPQQVMDLVLDKGIGNPFFSEELLLALRDAGLLSVVSGVCILKEGVSTSEMASYLPDSIQSVINIRMDKLDRNQGIIIKTASVIGRIFSVHMLKDVIEGTDSELSISQLSYNLLHLVNIGLLITQKEDEYSFKHALMMDVAYNRIPLPQRKEIHTRVAQYYESTYDSDERAPFYPQLAHHWLHAENRKKALIYYEKAGDSAMKSFAIGECIEFFNKVLTLVKERGDEPLHSQSQIAHCHTQLGIAYSHIGDPAKAYYYLSKSLELSKHKLPSSSVSIWFGIKRESFVKMLHSIFPGRFIGSSRGSTDRPQLEELSLVYLLFAQILDDSKNENRAMYAALRSLNIAETIGHSAQLGKSFTTMGVIYSRMRKRSQAAKCFGKGVKIAKELGDPSCTMWVQSLVGTYYHGICEWSNALKSYSKLLKWSLKSGSKRYAEEALCKLASWNYTKGNFNKQYQFAREAYESSTKRGDTQNRIHSGLIVAHALILFDDIEEAIKVLEDAKRTLFVNTGLKNSWFSINIIGLLSVSYMYKREFERSKSCFIEGLSVIKNVGESTSFLAYIGYTALMEVVVTLSGEDADDREMLMRGGKIILNFLKIHSVNFPVSRCTYAYWKGCYAWSNNRKVEAMREWKSSLSIAEKQDMPFEQAMSLYSLGKHDHEHVDYLDQAMKIFKKVGAIHQLEKVKSRKRSEHKFGASLTFDKNMFKMKKMVGS